MEAGLVARPWPESQEQASNQMKKLQNLANKAGSLLLSGLHSQLAVAQLKRPSTYTTICWTSYADFKAYAGTHDQPAEGTGQGRQVC